MTATLGHICHLHEDGKLTFSFLKQIISQLNGSLVCEKFDGMLLSFKGDKFARSAKEIAQGGLNPVLFLDKFQNTKVKQAFQDAIEQLIHFNLNEKWYHIEVVDPRNKNVLAYDEPALVFHSDDIGNHKCHWRVLQRKDCLHSLSISQQTIKQVLQELQAFRHHTNIQDMLFQNVLSVLKQDYDVTASTAQFIALQISNREPFLAALKPKLSTREYETAQKINLNMKTLLSLGHEPLERVLSVFGQSIIDGMSSVLIRDGNQENARNKHELMSIKSSLEPQQQQKVCYHVKKLAWYPESSRTAIEGFLVPSTPYKVTGMFAPMNQIMGVRKYA